MGGMATTNDSALGEKIRSHCEEALRPSGRKAAETGPAAKGEPSTLPDTTPPPLPEPG